MRMKLLIPAACAIGAGAFFYVKKRRRQAEAERIDSELAGNAYPGE